MKNSQKTADSRDASKELDRDIDRVAASIRQFRVEAQRFFAGDLKLPPETLRARIATDLRRLRAVSTKGAAANFRLGTLEAQFQSHLDLFGRRLREREQVALSEPSAGEAAAPADPEKGVVLGPKDSAVAVRALYESFRQRNPKMDLDRFRTYVQHQADVIRAKTGCSEIQFRVAIQDGKTKLKAKPLRRST